MNVVKNPNRFISSSSSHHKIVVDENTSSSTFNFDDFKFVKPHTPQPKVGSGNVCGGVQQKRAKIVNE
jgi:hypothetical protein